MRVTVEVREETFRTPKTTQQIEEEVRQAAAMFWLARGDVAPEHARDVTAPPTGQAPEGREPMLYDLLILGPNVGDDADFERPRDT
jgi:hypothetical protein